MGGKAYCSVEESRIFCSSGSSWKLVPGFASCCKCRAEGYVYVYAYTLRRSRCAALSLCRAGTFPCMYSRTPARCGINTAIVRNENYLICRPVLQVNAALGLKTWTTQNNFRSRQTSVAQNVVLVRLCCNVVATLLHHDAHVRCCTQTATAATSPHRSPETESY